MLKQVNETAKSSRIETQFIMTQAAFLGLNQHWYPWGLTINNTS